MRSVLVLVHVLLARMRMRMLETLKLYRAHYVLLLSRIAKRRVVVFAFCVSSISAIYAFKAGYQLSTGQYQAPSAFKSAPAQSPALKREPQNPGNLGRRSDPFFGSMKFAFNWPTRDERRLFISPRHFTIHHLSAPTTYHPAVPAPVAHPCTMHAHIQARTYTPA